MRPLIRPIVSVVNDDARRWKLVRDTYERFKYRNIMTERARCRTILGADGRPVQ